MARLIAMVANATTAMLLVAGCSTGGSSEPAPVTSSLVAQARTSSAKHVPRPQHIVVVVEENRSYTDVLTGSDAPYLKSLAKQGANFSAAYAVAHPSQPNYLAMFSGSTQGLKDDSCPHTYTGPNLASQLRGEHLRFAGFSESMPSTGYSGCSSGDYARKHNPWSNFPSLPASDNRRWAQFGHHYASLPKVSFVIPNLKNDMHSGSIRNGDTWLRDHLADYAAWALTHDSLLVVTFDEDDGSKSNHIPTIVVGAGVRPGVYSEPMDHYRLLRTLEAMFGLPGLGHAAQRAPVTDIWSR